MKLTTFEFTVQGLTETQAELLLKIIVNVVELLGLTLAGGYHGEEKSE